jgi:hypothetical protein
VSTKAVGLHLAHPPQVMALTQTVPASGPLTCLDPASTAAEHRVLGGKHEHVGAEFGADRAE